MVRQASVPGQRSRVLIALFMALAATGAMAQSPASQLAGSAAAPGQSAPGPVFNVTVEREDAGALLKRLAAEAGVSIAFADGVQRMVTLDLRNATLDQAVSLITAAAGLSARRIGEGYLVGSDSTATAPDRAEATYRVRYVRADRLADTLKAAYAQDELRVVIGPDEYGSPVLGAATASSSSFFGFGTSTAAAAGALPGSPSPAASSGARELLLIGTSATVTKALALCRTMDRRRRQVKISVKISDVDTEALRQLGVKWQNSIGLTIAEQPKGGGSDTNKNLTPVFEFGKFLRDPLVFQAAIVALEQQGHSRLLATPSLSILDGESGYIMIGDRHLYPKITGYTAASTPVFDTAEFDVGIRLEVAAEIGANDEMVLTLFPQVSALTGYSETPQGNFPQVATREQRTTIQARNGETIVIGGLLKEGEIRGLRGVPGLSKIPLLGELFKFRDMQRTKTELVIMITPELLGEGGVAAATDLPAPPSAIVR